MRQFGLARKRGWQKHPVTRAHSRGKAATSEEEAASDPGGGGRHGGAGEKRGWQPTPMGAPTVTAEWKSLLGNSGSIVDEAAEVVMTGAAEMKDAATDEDAAVAYDVLYDTECAGMVIVDVDGDVSVENVLVSNVTGGTEVELGVESGALQSEDEAIVEAVELTAYSAHQLAVAEPKKGDRLAKYCLPYPDNGGIQVSDLVWSKLEGYPWWPGEIFDPSDASEMALKHQIKGNHLVSYFGDSTFAWSDESQLRPFMTNYARLEKQTNSDEFINAVNHALEELSRRILSGMSCSCLLEELSDSGISYFVENHGLRQGVTCSTANQAEILKYFQPENLLHYIRSLAMFPGQGGDLLELVIACSQLTSFSRSKGCSELASFQTASGWADNAMDTFSTKIVIIEDVTNAVHTNHRKPRKGKGRPRQWKPEDGIESTSNLNYSCTYDDPGVRQMAGNFVDFDDSQNGIIGDLEYVDELTVLERAKWRRMHKNQSVESKELFSQLCLVAIEPMNRTSFSATIISYFSYYRNYVITASTESSIVVNNQPKRGQKRVNVHSPDTETTDHMQDSYWSELSLHNDRIHTLKTAGTSKRPRHKQILSQERSVPLSQQLQPATLAPKKPIQVIERPIIYVESKMINELKPTALVLSFGRSAALPSEFDLIKMFGRYGPLKETETEVHRDTNSVKVVFKKRVDAERAFSIAGKQGTFGPSLRSYRLVNMPFSLNISQLTSGWVTL